VAIKLKNGNDVRNAIPDMKAPEMVLPKDLLDAASAAQKRQWKRELTK